MRSHGNMGLYSSMLMNTCSILQILEYSGHTIIHKCPQYGKHVADEDNAIYDHELVCYRE